MALNMFVYKKFGQTKRKKVLKKQGIGVVSGARLLLDKELTNCLSGLKYLHISLALQLAAFTICNQCVPAGLSRL